MISSSLTPYSALVRVPVNQIEIGVPLEVSGIGPQFEWDDAIVSWNVANCESSRLIIEVRSNSKWLQLADWHGDFSKGTRTSFKGQSERGLSIDVDTIKSATPRSLLDLRINLEKKGDGPPPKIKLLTVCFSSSTFRAELDSPKIAAREIAAPMKAQAPNEFGKLKYRPEKVSEKFISWFKSVKGAQYCSPTSASMVLGYWSKRLEREDLNRDVPDIATAVFDERYPGTGNWSFNTAVMGSFVGMKGYVSRFANMADLELLIESEIPVICSVSYNLLLGNGKPAGNDGHLVVLVGFDANGDPIFHDPGQEKQIRRTYRRIDFWKAWCKSGRTVYMCHPAGAKIPKLTDSSVLSGG